MPRLIVLLLSLFICVTPATASTLYTFSGANGLSGSFVLDETTPFAVTIHPILGTFAVLSSPLNHISGTFDAFSFVGVPFLTIADLPASALAASDHWIVRAPISGPAVNGLTPQQLNLFIYRSSGGTMPISHVPPEHNVNPFEFQYTFGFTDGSFVGGPLSTLTMVPEPTTIITLALGLIALMARVTVIGRIHRLLAFR